MKFTAFIVFLLLAGAALFWWLRTPHPKPVVPELVPAPSPAPTPAPTPGPSPTPPPQPAARLAPEGVLYVIKRFSEAAPDGIRGFFQGKEVRLVREEAGYYVVTDGRVEAKRPRSWFTRDLDLAAKLQTEKTLSDNRVQDLMEKERSAYEARQRQQQTKQPMAEQTTTSSDKRIESILGALNLQGVGLEKVKAAAAARDMRAAMRELAAYFRKRKGPAWRELPRGAKNTGVADAAVEGRVVGGLVAVEHQFPDGDIDWMFNATEDAEDIPYNQEWQVQLNRMHFWLDMCQAYRATGDEKYSRALAAQVRDWIEDCPVPDERKNAVPSTWRTIEAGIRMANSWPDAFYTLLNSPSFDDETLVAMLGSFLDHANYLRSHPTVGNWLAMEMNGLYTIGALFPEFKDAAAWRKFAAGVMAAEADKQFLPDGGQFELTPGYHSAAVDNFQAIVETARLTGHEAELPPGYVPALAKAFDFSLALMTPDRNVPRFNDSWPVAATSTFRKALRLFPERSDFRWAADPGSNDIPKFTSRFLDWSGYAVMRSAWSPAANYLVFDVGPLGFAHVHQDKLNIVLWAYGREILFDSGGASYEKSKWRDWSLSTASHNCILVDGLGQNIPEAGMERRATDPASVAQEAIDAGWISTPEFDYARGIYDGGFGPSRERIATHERQVLFLKPDIFVVADRLEPQDRLAHTYQARWHLITTGTRQDKISGEVVTTDAGLANLAVVPLLGEGLSVDTASALQEPEILGWNVRKDLTPPRLPCTTVLQTRQGKGTQHFLTLLLPLAADQPSPVQRITGRGMETTVELTGGRELRVSISGGLSVSESLPDGKPGRQARVRGISRD